MFIKSIKSLFQYPGQETAAMELLKTKASKLLLLLENYQKVNQLLHNSKQATAKVKEPHCLESPLVIRSRYRLISCSLQQCMLQFPRLLEHFEKDIAHSGYATPQRSSIGYFLYVPGTKMHSC